MCVCLKFFKEKTFKKFKNVVCVTVTFYFNIAGKKKCSFYFNKSAPLKIVGSDMYCFFFVFVVVVVFS